MYNIYIYIVLKIDKKYTFIPISIFYFQYDVSRSTLSVSGTVLRKYRNTDFLIYIYIYNHEKL